MESAKPFNVSISSTEIGFEKTECIQCENEGAVRVYDKLKLKQNSRPLDCSDSLSIASTAAQVKTTSLAYNSKEMTVDLSEIFSNEQTRCEVTSCRMYAVGCASEYSNSEHLSIQQQDVKWSIVAKRDAQLGYTERFCLGCKNSQQALYYDEVTVIQASQFSFKVEPLKGWIE